MELLQQIFLKHQCSVCDNWSSYLQECERIFAPYRDVPIGLLEIGVQNGASLQAWENFFPKAEKIGHEAPEPYVATVGSI